MARRKKAGGLLPRFGKLPPRYRFFLNPYPDLRWTSCPECLGKTRIRKVPLVVHVEPQQVMTLNKVCRLCPVDDLLIAHQDELEAFLAAYYDDTQPEIVGNDYLVLGTMDRPVWRKGMKSPPPVGDLRDILHDFKDYVTFTPAPRWGPA